MMIDWPHTILTAAIIFVVLLLLNRSGLLEGASHRKRTLITATAVFVPILMLNLLWPISGS